MLGNDVVDLTIDDKKYLNKKFINRVLSSNEKHYLSAAADKNNYLWSLWAIKESSYKACQKLDHQLIFSPIQFELNEHALSKLTTHDCKHQFTAVIIHRNTSLQLKLVWRHHPENCDQVTAVHATAIQSTEVTDLESVAVVISRKQHLSNYKSQSHHVRKLAHKIMAKHGVDAAIERPTLIMNGYEKPGPPILIANDHSKLPHEISLSHDHEWLAVALLVK